MILNPIRIVSTTVERSIFFVADLINLNIARVNEVIHVRIPKIDLLSASMEKHLADTVYDAYLDSVHTAQTTFEVVIHLANVTKEYLDKSSIQGHIDSFLVDVRKHLPSIFRVEANFVVQDELVIMITQAPVLAEAA